MIMRDSVDDFPDDDIDLLSSPVTLPNGVTIPNRLAKVSDSRVRRKIYPHFIHGTSAGKTDAQAAMEEGIPGGLPGRRHRKLYSRWGKGGWGVILTGNVQVDASQSGTPFDLRFNDDPHTVPRFHELHEAIIPPHFAGPDAPLTLVQLNHAGMQSSPTFSMCRAPWVPSIAPVSARPDLGSGPIAWAMARTLWPVPSRAVTDLAEWLDIAGRFVDAAASMEEAGWGGVQLHAAHGYLLAQYLSPLTNPHPHALPGVPDHIPVRLHLMWIILTGIHAVTAPRFVKALKINCSDFIAGGLDENTSAEIIGEIVSWRLVDLLEISGGTYTNPMFTASSMSPQTPSPRQSLFAHFTAALLPTLPAPPYGPAIMLTGGLHDRELIASSLRNKACHVAGIGRPAAVVPDLPRRVLLNRELDASKARIAYDIPHAEAARRLLNAQLFAPKPSPPRRWASHTSSHTSSCPSSPSSQASCISVDDPDCTCGENEAIAQANKGSGVKLVGAGIGTTWHEWQMARMGRGEEPDLELDWFKGLATETLWQTICAGGPVNWLKRWWGKDW